MEKKRKQELFARFFAGITSKAEQNELLKTPEVESMMREQWDDNQPPAEGVQKPQLYKILAAIYKRIAVSKPNTSIGSRNISLRSRLLAAAASVALLFSTGTVLWQIGIFSDSQLVTITTPHGAKSEVFLPDGSRVWLNSESKLSYNKDFDKKVREIEIEGEAFFNISHDPNRPVIVKTELADIEVLGTRFNLISKSSVKEWEAALVKGKIKVNTNRSGSAKSVSLSPGQKISWNKKANDFLLDKTNTSTKTRWVSNQLVFEDESFSNIATQLENTFGVQVDLLHPTVRDYRFTAKFSDESIYEIFSLLQQTASFNFHIRGNKVIVTEKPYKQN
ncbi:MAG: FecR family protein [Bacteroidales bacterium]